MNLVHRHFIINKPFGYLSQFVNNQTKRKNKKLLGELYDFPDGTMAIGRLDQKSEGLLLLTTDGKVSELIRSRSITKEYTVQVDGIITTTAIDKMRAGLEITLVNSKHTTAPCEAHLLPIAPFFDLNGRKPRDPSHGPTSWFSITLSEGKFRQIRKMSAAVGFPTLRLIRVRIGNIRLNQMLAGDIIEVDQLDY